MHGSSLFVLVAAELKETYLSLFMAVGARGARRFGTAGSCRQEHGFLPGAS